MANSNRIEHAAAAWLARHDAGGWAEHDQAELDDWLAASTAHRVAWLRLRAVWRESDRLKALGAGLPAGQMPTPWRWASQPGNSADASTPQPRAKAWPTGGTPAAASRPCPVDAAALVFAPRRQETKSRLLELVATIAIVTALLTFGWSVHSPTVQPVTYVSPVGALETILLADGSEVTLSSDSRIVVALSRRERHIDLQRGEVFFRVAKDPARPFVVTVAGHQAIAVGTRFAVRRDTNGIRIVVTEGLVRLESDPDADGRRQPTALLPAGSVALANPYGVVVQSGSVDKAKQTLMWRDGFLAFHDTSLAAAATEFNRYNVRKIIIADPSVAALRVGGSFRWSNAEAFVRLLEQGFPVRAEYNDAAIVLHRRQ